MGWEKRGNRSYHYRKKRLGGKVVSVYVGRGEVAKVMAEQDRLDRVRKEVEREATVRMLQEMKEADRVPDEVEEAVRLLTKAYLVANGFHAHKGQWRKRSDGNAAGRPQGDRRGPAKGQYREP